MADKQDWDAAYQAYEKQLKEGSVDADFIKSLYAPLGGDFADRIVALHKDITKQSDVNKWWGGDIGKEDAAWDMAFRLAETGAGSLSDIGQRQVPAIIEGENGPMDAGYTVPEAYNKRTGEPLTNFNRSGFDSEYNLQFTDDGRVIPYTQNEASDWTDFREFAKTAANTIGMMTPMAPYIAAANAANFASKGEWGKAILSALPAAGKFAGAAGAAADTVSAINQANKYANILKSLEDKNLLGLAFQGADLAGVKELAGYDLNDVKKAVNLGMAIKNEDPTALLRAGAAFAPKGAYGHDPSMIEEGAFKYSQVFDPKEAGLVDMSEQPIEGYEFTKDFTPGTSLELFSDLQGPGIKAPPVETEVFRPDGSVNYDIFNLDGYDGEPRLRMPDAPNLESMGGGQGFVVPVDGGVMTESGFIPTGYTSDLGDPGSFINKEATGGDVSDRVQKALDAGAKETYKDIQKQNETKTQTQQSGGVDLAALMSLLGGQQPAPYMLSVPENKADIELMQDIFGPSLSAPSTGDENARADALARLLRS